MEDKYYFPKIEEFHVGFEYEQHEVINERDPHWKMMVKKIGFSKKEINQVFYNVDLVENLNQKRIRVKYLDKEDIESFGFKCTGDCGVEKEFQKNYKYGWIFLEMSFDNKIMIDYEWENDTIGHTSTNTLFVGKIKNKSELKKLLMQLEIINE